MALEEEEDDVVVVVGCRVLIGERDTHRVVFFARELVMREFLPPPHCHLWDIESRGEIRPVGDTFTLCWWLCIAYWYRGIYDAWLALDSQWYWLVLWARHCGLQDVDKLSPLWRCDCRTLRNSQAEELPTPLESFLEELLNLEDISVSLHRLTPLSRHILI